MIGLDQLRAHAIARTFPEPTTLSGAIRRLGFVQADPIRAPARAQDLTLRHRVRDYRAGDLERRYASLAVDEDYLVNYGFLPRAHLALMHPREPRPKWDAVTRRRADALLDFIDARGPVHPREVAARFAHGRAINAWGGSSNATTRLLDGMHYRGMLRVVRRENGIRIYAAHRHPSQPSDTAARTRRAEALLALVVGKYAPLPQPSLAGLVAMLDDAAPHLKPELQASLRGAKALFAHASVDGTDWYWPPGERPGTPGGLSEPRLRLLAPFDPLVWDRRRFERFWGWAYRFEAYTPAPKRRLGYYAMPLLWRDAVIGWGNLAVVDGRLVSELGYVCGHAPRDRAFKRELEAEIERMKVFLRLEESARPDRP